jgi:hypothetical protein
MSNFNIEGFGQCTATNFPNNNCLITKLFANTYIDSSVNIIGEVRMFTGTTLPSGWMYCDGRMLDGSDSQYSALYNVIGTNYGEGDGETYQFNLPNLTQRMPIGSTSQNQRFISYQGNNVVSSGNKTISSNQMTNHSHTYGTHLHKFQYGDIAQVINVAGNMFSTSAVNTNFCKEIDQDYYFTNLTTSPNTTETSGNAGSGADYLPPFTTVSFMIFYGFYS